MKSKCVSFQINFLYRVEETLNKEDVEEGEGVIVYEVKSHPFAMFQLSVFRSYYNLFEYWIMTAKEIEFLLVLTKDL